MDAMKQEQLKVAIRAFFRAAGDMEELCEEIILTMTLPANLAEITAKAPVLAKEVQKWTERFCKISAEMK